MRVNLKNCISHLKSDGRGTKYTISEAYDNLVELIARVKLGDVAAADEFESLYCMENDVQSYLSVNGAKHEFAERMKQAE